MSVATEGIRRRDPSRERMPIEELARVTGVTVRNLRAMHARSILQPPDLVGRKGFYNERHVARVTLVLKLQGRGFSLAAIEALIESWQAGGGLVELMGLEDALVSPGANGRPSEVAVRDALPELLDNPRALAKAQQSGLVVERDGQHIAPNAELLGLVKRQVAEGFPLEHLLDEGVLLRADVLRIAERFRQSFFTHVVQPRIASDAPPSALSEVASKIEVLRPLATRLVSIMLATEIERGGGPTQASAVMPVVEPTARKPVSARPKGRAIKPNGKRAARPKRKR